MEKVVVLKIRSVKRSWKNYNIFWELKKGIVWWRWKIYGNEIMKLLNIYVSKIIKNFLNCLGKFYKKVDFKWY